MQKEKCKTYIKSGFSAHGISMLFKKKTKKELKFRLTDYPSDVSKIKYSFLVIVVILKSAQAPKTC